MNVHYALKKNIASLRHILYFSQIVNWEIVYVCMHACDGIENIILNIISKV